MGGHLTTPTHGLNNIYRQFRSIDNFLTWSKKKFGFVDNPNCIVLYCIAGIASRHRGSHERNHNGSCRYDWNVSKAKIEQKENIVLYCIVL